MGRTWLPPSTGRTATLCTCQGSRFRPWSGLPLTSSAVAEDKDYLFIAIPSLHLLTHVKRITGCNSVREGRVVIAALTKGLIKTPGGIRLVTEAIEDYLPGMSRNKLVYVPDQPCHRSVQGKITGLISASRSGRNSIRVRELLSGGSLVVFSSLDVRGVQVSAALKNVVAIAFGMLDALKETSDRFGDNTESLLLAAGLNEILAIGKAMGAAREEPRLQSGRRRPGRHVPQRPREKPSLRTGDHPQEADRQLHID